MWPVGRYPPSPSKPSHLADRLTGFCRFGDGLKSSDGVENLFRPDRIGCNTGDCVGEGFEVGLDRVDRRKAQMLRFLTAAPQHQIGPSERFGRGLAAKGMKAEVSWCRAHHRQGPADARGEFEQGREA